MKRLIILLVLGLFAFSVTAQERTVTKDVPKGNTYYKYVGTSSDVLLPTTRDTIDLVFQLELTEKISKIAVKSRFDVVAGADTTVAISVDGKLFSDDSYTNVIASALSTEVSADNVVKTVSTTYTESHSVTAFNVVKDALTITNAAFDVPFTNPSAGTADTLEFPSQTLTVDADTLEFPTQTVTVTPADYSYRYIRVRYILQGNDSVGTGIKIDEVELKVYL